MKKIGALLLAIVMVLSLTGVAMASEAIGAEGIYYLESGSVTSITIPKKIDVNGSLSSVYSPNVTYTFSLAPVAPAGATITDGQAVTSVVTKGVDGGATLASPTVEFTSAETAVDTDITKDLTVNVSIDKFTKPGVYRYELKDVTTAAVLNAAGITRPRDYTDTYYLDVYIRYNADHTALQAYGYVLSEENDSKTVSSDNKVAKIDDDKYYTVDVTLTKIVTGAMGDVKHEFPFSITLANKSLYYYADKNSEPTVEKDTSNTTISMQLKSGDTYYLTGLSPLATVVYNETNDTADTYTLTITGADDSVIGAAANIAALSGTKNTGEPHAVSNYTGSTVQDVKADNAFKAVTFTNNLDEISPTGVVLRIAPYAMILVAGLALMVISRRRNAIESDEE